MFELVDGSPGLGGQVFEACPHEEGAGDVVALDAGLAALAGLQPRGLLGFAMRLLDLPAEAARLARRLRRILSQVVGHDPVRAVGGHLDPEQAQLVLFGKAVDFDGFAPSPTRPGSSPRHQSAGRASGAGVIDLPVGFQRTVVDLAEGLDEQHQILGRIPTVHQHRLEGQALLVNHIGQHLMDMVELGLAIAVRVVEAEVDEPELANNFEPLFPLSLSQYLPQSLAFVQGAA